ncbi:hypothetical protein M3Y98_01046400 [Aphelenchoides besseyi]|nr:hypothetical protein M3Y98_01046400 [Aphelenchoides besseyi]
MLLPDISCFDKDEHGFDIVDLPQDTPLLHGVRLIHRVVAYFFSIGGILLNMLLIYFILFRSQQLGEMRPILLFSVTVDLIDAICYFLLMPFVFTSFGYHITFGNGWFSFHNTHGNALLTGITAAVLISTWGFIPIQFLWRKSLVTDGGRPHGTRLFIYVFGTALGAIFASICAINCYITTPPEYVNNSLKILRHSGFVVDSDFVHGAVVIQRFLKQLAPRMSSATRRMHQDMTRVLFALAVGPLINHFVPALHTSASMIACHNAAVSSMISSCFLVLTPVLNAFFTMLFIRPYRRIIAGWCMGVIGMKQQGTSSIHSVGGGTNAPEDGDVKPDLSALQEPTVSNEEPEELNAQNISSVVRDLLRKAKSITKRSNMDAETSTFIRKSIQIIEWYQQNWNDVDSRAQIEHAKNENAPDEGPDNDITRVLQINRRRQNSFNNLANGKDQILMANVFRDAMGEFMESALEAMLEKTRKKDRLLKVPESNLEDEVVSQQQTSTRQKFLYRSYTLKFGEPPKGQILWFYICSALIGVGIAGWISCTLYFGRVPEFRTNAMKILRSVGYLHIKEESLHGSHSNETKFYLFINCMGGFVYLCYGIVIYTQLAMRKHFRNLSQHMSATTKRMHQDLTRALIALAVFPFITYIVAGSCAMYSVAQCRDMGLANCLCSILYTLSPMVNAITTVILIRPYRLTILEWMGCKERGSGNKIFQTTGQSLSVSFNSQSAVATISSQIPLASSDS